VHWPALKRALDATFSVAHGSASSLPFVILDVQLPIEHVDVNLHPTKAEVAILHEDAVIQGICTSVQHVLKQHHEIQAVQRHHSAGNPVGQLEAARVRTDRTAQTIASLARGPVMPVGSHTLSDGSRPGGQPTSHPFAEDTDGGLVDVLKRHVPVGISGYWWLLQHGADLYMLDLRIVAEELAHQQCRLCWFRLRCHASGCNRVL
jgi:hypothetical protein